jgi:hypothetical protein
MFFPPDTVSYTEFEKVSHVDTKLEEVRPFGLSVFNIKGLFSSAIPIQHQLIISQQSLITINKAGYRD